MKQKKNLLLASVLLLQSVAFSQTNSLVKHLPDDATIVVHFDVKRIAGKIPGETFRQSFLYREMMKDRSVPISTFFTNPQESGIDLSAGIILAMKIQGTDRYEKPQPIIYLFGKIQNAETFTSNIKKLLNGDTEQEAELINVYGTDRILSTGGKMTAGWNNDVFVITSGYSEEIANEIYKYHHFEDTAAVIDTTTKPPFDISGLMERFKKSQRELCFQLLEGKSQNSFSTNPHFTSMMNTEGDIKIWSGGGTNPIFERALTMAPFLSKLQALTGGNKTSVINFENGKVVMQSRNFPETTVADIYKKYPATGQNTDLLRRLPEGTLMGLMNMSYNQDMAKEMMQKSGLAELLDSVKGKIPFDISLASGVFKNNMMLAVLKSDVTANTDEQTTKMEGLKLIVALPIADKIKFQKFKEAIMPLWDSLKVAKGDKMKDPTPFVKYNDELLVISLSPEVATAYLNNTSSGTVPEWLQTFSKYPMVMNLNMKELMGMMLGKKRAGGKVPINENKMLNIFDQMIMYGGEYENESINNTIELRLSNKNENSVKQLFDMMNGMAEEKDEVIMSDNNQPPPQEEMKVEVDSVKVVEIVEIKQDKTTKPPPPPPPPAKPKTKNQKFTPPVIKKD